MSGSQEAGKLLERTEREVRLILINRPEKKNAIDLEMYVNLGNAIRHADHDHKIKAIVISGMGNVFSSGNDLNNFGQALADGLSLDQAVERGRPLFEEFVNSVLRCSKAKKLRGHNSSFTIFSSIYKIFDG